GDGLTRYAFIPGWIISQRFRRWFAGANADQPAIPVFHGDGKNTGALAGIGPASDLDGPFIGVDVASADRGIHSPVMLPGARNSINEFNWRGRSGTYGILAQRRVAAFTYRHALVHPGTDLRGKCRANGDFGRGDWHATGSSGCVHGVGRGSCPNRNTRRAKN